MINFLFLTSNFGNMRILEKLKIEKGMRVLLRTDYNVPMRGTSVLDSSRITATLPTIEYLLGRGARVIIISHLGRPEGRAVKELSLRPIAEALAASSGRPVKFLDFTPGDPELLREIESMPSASLAMMENLRFNPGEEKNDPAFIKELSRLGDAFVNDAFGAAHRKSASIAGLPKLLPSSAGILLEQEVEMLRKLLEKPEKPFVILAGGAKVSDKIGVIKNLSKSATRVLLGGGVANSLFAAAGYGIGQSLSSPEEISLAKKMLKDKHIMLPVDVVVGEKGKEKSARVVAVGKSPHELASGRLAIMDIGPETVLRYSEEIKKAKTIVWNGPMGYFEEPQFSAGTIALARIFASRSRGPAFGVVGGGETAEALRRTKMEEMVDWVSTGGGAMLEFLEGKKLPGIKALS